MFTRRLAEGSGKSIIAGVELKTMNSGEVCRKGTARFGLLLASLNV
jgi:hypothetical protein